MRPYLAKRAREFNRTQSIEATIDYDEELNVNVLNKNGVKTVLMDLQGAFLRTNTVTEINRESPDRDLYEDSLSETSSLAATETRTLIRNEQPDRDPGAIHEPERLYDSELSRLRRALSETITKTSINNEQPDRD